MPGLNMLLEKSIVDAGVLHRNLFDSAKHVSPGQWYDFRQAIQRITSVFKRVGVSTSRQCFYSVITHEFLHTMGIHLHLQEKTFRAVLHLRPERTSSSKVHI